MSFSDKHKVPVIKGWDGDFYAIDHHHLTRALMDSTVPKADQIMYATVIDDFSDTTELEFWSKMIENGYTWLVDERGSQPFSPLHLPSDMSELTNDFYRSLSYFTRVSGGYAKSNISYAEFIWAGWFRTQLPLPWPTHIPPPLHFNQLPKVIEAPSVVKWNVCDVFPYEPPCLKHEPSVVLSLLPKAVQLAKSPAAAHLPGFGQGENEGFDCDLNSLPTPLRHNKLPPKAKHQKRRSKHSNISD